MAERKEPPHGNKGGSGDAKSKKKESILGDYALST